MAITFVGTLQQGQGTVLNRGLDFTPWLRFPSSTTIATADIPDVTGIVITNDAPNTATFTNDDDVTVAIRKGVLFTLDTRSATAGTTYTLTVDITITTTGEIDKYYFYVEVI